MQKGIFGIYRWFLSCCVVAAHLAPKTISQVGYYSVFAFFVLSSYLVSFNLESKYFQQKNGILIYLKKRFLRIYPLYFVAIIPAYLALKANPGISKAINNAFAMPLELQDIMGNIIIIGNTSFLGQISAKSLIPPAWSISAEIYFWCLIPVFLKNKPALKIWTACTILLAIILFEIKAPFQIIYYSPLGYSAAFCAGVWLYLLKEKIPKINHKYGALAILTMLCIYILSNNLGLKPYFGVFYLAFFANCFVISYLSQVELKNITKKIVSIDLLAGRLSYSIFLFHITAGFYLKYLFPDTFTVHSTSFFISAFLFSNLIAIMIDKIYRYFDRH